MRNLVGAIVALAILCVSGLTRADEIDGMVAAADIDKFMLDDGTVFILAEGVSADHLKPGVLVRITFEKKDGKMIATAIQTRDSDS